MKKVILIGLLLSLNAFADTIGPDVPFPLKFANRYLELAADAPYTLRGKIVIKKKLITPGKPHPGDADQPYFVVDLKRHPWLANPKRACDSSYPIITIGAVNTIQWADLADQDVQITGYARAVENLSESEARAGLKIVHPVLSFEPKVIKVLSKTQANRR